MKSTDPSVFKTDKRIQRLVGKPNLVNLTAHSLRPETICVLVYVCTVSSIGETSS